MSSPEPTRKHVVIYTPNLWPTLPKFIENEIWLPKASLIRPAARNANFVVTDLTLDNELTCLETLTDLFKLNLSSDTRILSVDFRFHLLFKEINLSSYAYHRVGQLRTELAEVKEFNYSKGNFG